MIGLDTNVLVRHLVGDDRRQAEAAHRFFSHRSSDDPAFISTAVIVETIGVLAYSYRMQRTDIARLVRSLLSTREVIFEAPAALHRALHDADDANVELVDAIIAHAAIDAGCDGTVTFDHRAQRLPGMLPVG